MQDCIQNKGNKQDKAGDFYGVDKGRTHNTAAFSAVAVVMLTQFMNMLFPIFACSVMAFTYKKIYQKPAIIPITISVSEF